MKRFIALLLVIMLSGCATIQERPLLLELTVRAATARLLHEHPSWREETLRITSTALLLVNQSDAAPLALIEQYVVSQIKWDGLQPEERELIRVLIGAIRQEVEAHNVEVPSEVVVAQVLGWIHSAAGGQ